MKYVLIAAFLFAASSVKAQFGFKFVNNFQRIGEPHPAYPFWDGRSYIWYNDSVCSFWAEPRFDSVQQLQMQVSYLLIDDLEAHRKLDSLIGELRKRQL